MDAAARVLTAPLPFSPLNSSPYSPIPPSPEQVDAAARVLDPIIAPLRRQAAGEKADPPFGCFLKDYAKCEW